VGSAGARGAGPRGSARQRHRRVRGHQHQRLRVPRRRHQPSGRVLRKRELDERGRGPALVRARPAGTERVARYRLLLFAGRGAPGLSEPAQPGVPPGAGGRREPDPQPLPLHAVLQGPHARRRRPLQDLRRRGRRLRAGRGLRGGRPQAAGRRRGRPRPDPGRRPGHGREPGRPQWRADRPQRHRAGSGDPPRAVRGGHPGRGRRVRGGARDGHRSRRPHRDPRARLVPRARPAAGAAAPRRLREDQRRPPRVGGGRRGLDQGRPVPPSRRDPAAPAPEAPEPLRPVGRAADHDPHRAHVLAGRIRPSDRGGQLLRFHRDERARRPRGAGRRRRAHRRGGPPAARPGPFGPDGDRPRGGGREAPGSSRGQPHAAAGRRRLHGRGGPIALRSSAGPGRRIHGPGARAAGCGRGGTGSAGSGARLAARDGAARGRVPVHGAGLAIRGDGPRALRVTAGVSPDAGPLRRAASGRAAPAAALRPLPGGRRIHPARRDAVHAAGSLRPGVRPGRALAELGRGTRRGARPQRGRVRRRVRRRRLHARRRPRAGGGARTADASPARGRRDGGHRRRRSAGPGRSLHPRRPRLSRRAQRPGEHRDLRRGRGGGGGMRVARRRGCAERAVEGVARLPLASDGADAPRLRGGGGRRGLLRPAPRSGLEPDGRRRRRGDGFGRLLAAPPAGAGALLRRHGGTARPWLPRVRRDRAQADAPVSRPALPAGGRGRVAAIAASGARGLGADAGHARPALRPWRRRRLGRLRPRLSAPQGHAADVPIPEGAVLPRVPVPRPAGPGREDRRRRGARNRDGPAADRGALAVRDRVAAAPSPRGLGAAPGERRVVAPRGRGWRRGGSLAGPRRPGPEMRSHPRDRRLRPAGGAAVRNK